MARGKLLSLLSCSGLQLLLFPVSDPKPLLFSALVASFKVRGKHFMHHRVCNALCLPWPL